MSWEYIVGIIVDIAIIILVVWASYNWGFKNGVKASKAQFLKESPPKEEDKP